MSLNSALRRLVKFIHNQTGAAVDFFGASSASDESSEESAGNALDQNIVATLEVTDADLDDQDE